LWDWRSGIYWGLSSTEDWLIEDWVIEDCPVDDLTIDRLAVGQRTLRPQSTMILNPQINPQSAIPNRQYSSILNTSHLVNPPIPT
jgi:hypothetical protein